MKFETIEEAIDFVTSLKNTGHTFEDFKKLVNDLGNPQNHIKTIHVAGTDGKGSTVAYLRDLLMGYGYKVGTYTSPHYIVHQDRIRINNKNIDDTSFVKYLNKYYSLYSNVNLSMFEYDYLIMLDYFLNEKVDYAIVEVGLGGRLDSTNVIDNPLLSIITTIGYDHMEKLGDTLVKICGEKCGIIKPNCPVVIGHLIDGCNEVVKKKCETTNSNLTILPALQDLGNRKFIFDDKEYQISSYAKYQIHNASLALCAFKQFCEIENINRNYEIEYNALLHSTWQARFEIVHENPRIILDGAHNIHGIEALMESYDQLSGSKCIIFSALKRKEYHKMIELAKKHCDRLIITTFENNEVIDLKEFSNYECINDYKEAINIMKNQYDNILICGSLYFMSEVVLNYKFD